MFGFNITLDAIMTVIMLDTYNEYHTVLKSEDDECISSRYGCIGSHNQRWISVSYYLVKRINTGFTVDCKSS